MHDIMLSAKQNRDVNQRIEHIRNLTKSAKTVAKKAMAKHHPDKGGDPKIFISIKEAIDSIEHHRDKLIEEFNQKKINTKKKRKPYIEFK